MADIVKLIYKGDEMAQWGGSASVDPATTSTVGTVRVATSSEWDNGTATWSKWEYLMAPINRIKSLRIKEDGWSVKTINATAKWVEVTDTVNIDAWTIFSVTTPLLFVSWQDVVSHSISWATKLVSMNIPTTNSYSWNTLTLWAEISELWIATQSWEHTLSLTLADVWTYTIAELPASLKRLRYHGGYKVA